MSGSGVAVTSITYITASRSAPSTCGRSRGEDIGDFGRVVKVVSDSAGAARRSDSWRLKSVSRPPGPAADEQVLQDRVRVRGDEPVTHLVVDRLRPVGTRRCSRSSRRLVALQHDVGRDVAQPVGTDGIVLHAAVDHASGRVGASPPKPTSAR
jgi:hypothetical protein